MALEFLRYWQLTSKEIRFYDTYGYLCLPGLISREAAAELAEEVLQVMEGLGISRGVLREARSSKDKLRQTRQYLAGTNLDRLINSEGLNLVGGATDGRPIDALPAIYGGEKRRWRRAVSRSSGQSVYALRWTWHQYLDCAGGNDAGQWMPADCALHTS